MMNIILFGPPGAGKGTQAKMICKKYNLLHLSTGDILREEIRSDKLLANNVKEIINSGKLVSDEIIIGLIDKIISKNKNTYSGYLFDGFPRNKNQAILLTSLLKKNEIKLNSVLLFDVNESVLLERILSRKEIEGRDDDNEDVLTSRLKVYYDEAEPLIEHYSSHNLLKKIDGIGEINEVNQRINLVLGKS